MEDSKIIELFFERSEQAISALSEKYGNACQRIAYNILNDKRDAEECVNDTYLAVWNTVPPQKPDPLIAYVGKIARNIALKRYRSNTAQKRNSHYDTAFEELENTLASQTTVEQELGLTELSSAINSFLESLDQQDRVMFVRRYYFSDGISDIASRFGITNHAVSVKLMRLRDRLKKHLIKEGFEI